MLCGLLSGLKQAPLARWSQAPAAEMHHSPERDIHDTRPLCAAECLLQMSSKASSIRAQPHFL